MTEIKCLICDKSSKSETTFINPFCKLNRVCDKCWNAGELRAFYTYLTMKCENNQSAIDAQQEAVLEQKKLYNGACKKLDVMFQMLRNLEDGNNKLQAECDEMLNKSIMS